jgi:hypothetical protein
MTTWVGQDLGRSLTSEECDRREAENDHLRTIWEDKHRPENIVVCSSSEAPRPFLDWLPRPRKS